MSIRMTYQVDRDRDLDGDTLRGRCGGNGATSPAKLPAPMTHPRVQVRDRGRDGSSPRKSAPRPPVWLVLLEIGARVALALSLTGAFAIALKLYAGLAFGSPNMVQACEGVFLWTLVLVSCGLSGRDRASPA